MFRNYVLRLIFRTCVFTAALLAYFHMPGLFTDFFSYKLNCSVIPVYFVWATMMLDMAHQFFPNSVNSVGSQKHHPQFYAPAREGYDNEALTGRARQFDKRARYVFFLWLAVFFAVAVLFFLDIFSTGELVLTALLFYVCDLICVIFWCPFQSIFMKNRCCVTCRIYNWDWFMICSPLVMIPSFLSWSLIAVSIAVLIKWECTYKKHPERFWEGSNALLRCESCTEKLCKIKKPVELKGDEQK